MAILMQVCFSALNDFIRRISFLTILFIFSLYIISLIRDNFLQVWSLIFKLKNPDLALIYSLYKYKAILL